MKTIRIYFGIILNFISFGYATYVIQYPTDVSFFLTIIFGSLPVLAILIGVENSVKAQVNNKFGENGIYSLAFFPGTWVIFILIFFRDTSYRDGLAILLNLIISSVLIIGLRNH
jgi:hypothetical protein